MADSKVSTMPPASSVADADLVPIVQGGVNKRAPASLIRGAAGGVTAVSGTAPIVVTGTSAPAVSITAATTGAAGSMSSADKTKLNSVATDATANSTDAQLRERSTHTGTQVAATVSDFAAAARLQMELALQAGPGVSLRPSGSGAATRITFEVFRPVVDDWYATAAQGALAGTALQSGSNITLLTNNAGFTANAGTVTSVNGGAGLTGAVTTSGALAVGAGTGITVNADDVAINRTLVDTWYAPAGATGATNLDGLTDVTVTAPANNQVLQYNGSQWVNAAAPASAAAPGVGAASYRWLSAAQSADPSNGNVGANTADWLLATELWISTYDINNVNIAAWLAVRKVGDRIRVQNANNAGVFISYICNAAPVNNSTFYAIPVTRLESSGLEFNNSQPVTVAFTAAVVNTDPTGITGASSVVNMISLTQAAYTALPTKNAATLYVIMP